MSRRVRGFESNRVPEDPLLVGGEVAEHADGNVGAVGGRARGDQVGADGGGGPLKNTKQNANDALMTP